MQISLPKLNQLITVADLGSFSKAAAELNLSQPALSRSVAALEERYGVRIFNRVGHGVIPTASGRQVIAQARALLRSMRVFDKNLHLHASGEAGELSLGLGPQLASQFLPGLVKHLFGISPRIRVKSLIRPGPALIEALQSDAIELFFCPSTQLKPSDGVEMHLLGRLNPCFLVRSTHPLARKSDVRLKDVARFPIASAVDMGLPSGTDWRPPAFICDNYHILREAVLETDFVWLCAGAFVARELEHGTLVEIAVTDHALEKSPIVAAMLSGRILSPLAQRTLDYMTSALAPTGSDQNPA